MDTLVFDIETQNFFTDPGVGWNNFGALKISAVGVYSYEADRYECFEELEIGKVAELFAENPLLVGFSINRYDVPVLNHYFRKLPYGTAPNVWDMRRFDLLEKIETATGKRVSLNALAQHNLGIGKTGRGAEAIELYRNGDMERLKEYCLQDVRITKGLYDLYRTQGFLAVPDRDSGTHVTVTFPRQDISVRLF